MIAASLVVFSRVLPREHSCKNARLSTHTWGISQSSAHPPCALTLCAPRLRLRLNGPWISIKYDDLDAPTATRVSEIVPHDPSAKPSHRKAPANGVADTAVDAAVNGSADGSEEKVEAAAAAASAVSPGGDGGDDVESSREADK